MGGSNDYEIGLKLTSRGKTHVTTCLDQSLLQQPKDQVCHFDTITKPNIEMYFWNLGRILGGWH